MSETAGNPLDRPITFIDLAAQRRRIGASTEEAAVHYSKPLPDTAAYGGFPVAPGGTPVAADLSARVLSLPFHADLDPTTQDRIIDAVRACIAGAAGAVRRPAPAPAS